jgi:AcrR family transcriptional regulator
MAAKKSSRRRPLDREAIERAALDLIEKAGLEELSMRRLGKKLGVEAMSLYHHFPSKAHLLDALVERLIVTLPAPDPNLAWRQRIAAQCFAYRALAAKHPRFAPFLIVHRMNTRVTLTWLERMAKIFSDGGFGPEAGARAFRTMSYFLMGAVLDETSGYAQGPGAAEPVPEAEQRSLAPTVASFGPYFGREHWDATFERGFGALLDELERWRLRELELSASARAAPAAPPRSARADGA